MPAIPGKQKIQYCARAMQAGKCVAYPTEGVWGLGCDPWNSHAVNSILKLKNRPASKGLILISGDIHDFDFLLNALDQVTVEKIKATWPGHTTWLVPHLGLIPKFISGDSDKVAVRVSAHPLVAQLSKAFGGPIVSTSANPAGKPSAMNALQVRRYFSRHDLSIAPGRVGQQKTASSIIDACTGTLIR